MYMQFVTFIDNPYCVCKIITFMFLYSSFSPYLEAFCWKTQLWYIQPLHCWAICAVYTIDGIAFVANSMLWVPVV